MFPTNLRAQKSASIQPRASPVKFASSLFFARIRLRRTPENEQDCLAGTPLEEKCGKCKYVTFTYYFTGIRYTGILVRKIAVFPAKVTHANDLGPSACNAAFKTCERLDGRYSESSDPVSELEMDDGGGNGQAKPSLGKVPPGYPPSSPPSTPLSSNGIGTDYGAEL